MPRKSVAGRGREKAVGRSVLTALQALLAHALPQHRPPFKLYKALVYLTVYFALMVGSERRAVGVKRIPELAAASIKSIRKNRAVLQLNDGSLSIHVSGLYGLVSCVCNWDLGGGRAGGVRVEPWSIGGGSRTTWGGASTFVNG